MNLNPLFNQFSKPYKSTLVLLSISLVVLCLTNCSPQTSAPASIDPTATPGSMSQPSTGSISANGVLLPNRQLLLSFGVGGVVESVSAGLGESVQAGQILVQLDTTEAQIAVTQAEIELNAAQENLTLVEASIPAEQKVAKSSAALELMTAQQALEKLYFNADTAKAAAFNKLVAANQAVGEAKYQLYYFNIPSTLSGLDPVEALELAKEKLDRARADYEPYKNQPDSEEIQPNRNPSPQDEQQQRLKDRLAGAQRDYNAAMRQIELDASLADAEVGLADAVLVYERLQDGPDPDEVALAESRVANAQAQFDLVSNESQTAEKLALGQASVEAARAHLQATQMQRDQLTLSAPLEGMISAIHIDESEWAMPGAVVIEMLDLSSWLVETKNVGELQIGLVNIGQQAQVRFNTFQGETVSGQVIAISPQAVVQQGDITYTLVIALEPTDLNLRPGMTARVEIMIE
jgi:multidrug resistance efflux pump